MTAAPGAAAVRRVLIIVLLMHAAYGVEMGLAAVRGDIGLLGPDVPTAFRVQVDAVLLSWLLVLAIGLFAAIQRLGSRYESAGRVLLACEIFAIIVLLSPFAFYPFFVAYRWPLALLVCLPTTVLALWGVLRMQRYRRMAGWVPLAAFGWGALVGTSFGGGMNSWIQIFGPYHLPQTDPVAARQSFFVLLSMSAGTFEELGKAAGVAIAFILFRRHVNGLVSGVVLGAAAGLGFNLVESVQYVGVAESGDAALYQFFGRQVVGLPGSHLAFSAMAGAAFGLARHLRDPASQRSVIVSGLGCAIGAHFANDALLRSFGVVKAQSLQPGPVMDTLVVTPLSLLALQGPLIAIYATMLRRGLRAEAAELATGLAAEARGRAGAVTFPEIATLLRPARRFRLKVEGLRRGGIPAYRDRDRLMRAQVDLGARLQRSRQEPDADAGDLPEIRARVLRLKRRLIARAGPPHEVMT